MLQTRDVAALAGQRRPWLIAIGAFDGLHTGHRTILREMVAAARHLKAGSAVMTFEPHPLEILDPKRAPARLSTPAEKAGLLATAGIDCLVALDFTPEFAALPPEDFVRRFLQAGADVRWVYVGYNFTFGSRGLGSPALLSRLGGDLGFGVRVFAPLTARGTTISSTAIREALYRGDVGGAARLLGRPYRVTGLVAAGEGRGRTIGFPTANVQTPPHRVMPGQGVYAGWATAAGRVYPAVINCGRRPTYTGAGAAEVRTEAYLMGFDGDLYGQEIELMYLARLRDERRFGSTAELAAQIALDVRSARFVLAAGCDTMA